MKYVDYDLIDGRIKGFYDKEVNGNNIPTTAKEITDEVWQQLINNHGKYIVDVTKNPEGIINDISSMFKENIPSLNNIKQNKIKEMNTACQNTIISGFHSTAYQNTDKIYDSTLEDQANITGNALSAMSKLAGTLGCENDKFYYHAIGEEFTEWTPEETLALARDFKIFKEQQLLKNSQLQAYVDTLTTVEEVQSVTWDTIIPT